MYQSIKKLILSKNDKILKKVGLLYITILILIITSNNY